MSDSTIPQQTANLLPGLTLAGIMKPGFHSALYLSTAGIDCPDILSGHCAVLLDEPRSI